MFENADLKRPRLRAKAATRTGAKVRPLRTRHPQTVGLLRLRPPQLPGNNGSPIPPPGTNAYPPQWSEGEQRWQQPQQVVSGYGMSYQPPAGAPAESYPPTASPAVFTNRAPPPGGSAYPQQQPPPAPRAVSGGAPTTSWPHQPPAAPAWPRPRSDAPTGGPAYAPPPPPNNGQQRPLSAQSDASG